MVNCVTNDEAKVNPLPTRLYGVDQAYIKQPTYTNIFADVSAGTNVYEQFVICASVPTSHNIDQTYPIGHI
jgi:hypothetical protein